VGERPLVVIGMALQTLGMLVISEISKGSVQYYELVAPLVITGCGISLALPATQSASVGALPREAVGIASGIYSMTRQLGGAAGVAVLGSVFTSAGAYVGSGFTRALAGCGVLSLVGALAGLGITARRRTRGPVAPKAMEEVG
jgi:MFS family permease